MQNSAQVSVLQGDWEGELEAYINYDSQTEMRSMSRCSWQANPQPEYTAYDGTAYINIWLRIVEATTRDVSKCSVIWREGVGVRTHFEIRFSVKDNE
jgi:hypothetical protein